MRLRFALLAAIALGIGGCLGDDQPESTRIEGDTLTIYTSLPLRGSSAEAAQAVAAGERLALADAGRRVGSYRVRLVQLDSTRAEGATWDPGQVSTNAHRAIDDDTAIAYVGELDYGGSAVSLPITNDAGLLQVSPLDGLTSLTRRAPGSPRDGPERYYPSERRTFVRLVPTDLRLARALAGLLVEEGAERLTVIYDEGIYGRELAGQVIRLARGRGIDTSRPVEDRGEPEEVGPLARKVAGERPDAVVYSGTAGTTFAVLLGALRAELPDVTIWGGAGLGTPANDVAIGPGRTAWLQPVRPADRYPARGRALLRRLHHPGPEALYGYEAMSLVLDAIERGGADRRAVVRAALEPRARNSPLGRYSLLEGGDVSEGRFALFDHGFAFERLVR